MTNKLKHLLLAILLPLWGLGGFAQNYPVTISIQLQQPSPIYLSNYADSGTLNSPVKLQLTLNDLTIPNRQVRLKCYFQGGGVSLVSNDFVVGAKPIYLEGGFPLQLTNADLAPYFEFQNILGINPNQYAQALPEGIYNLYVEVYDFATGKKLSRKTGVTTVIFQNDPPFLNLPANQSGIMQQNIQNIIFNWTPRSINVSNVEYEFSLVEIWDKYTPVQNAFAYSPPLYTATTRNTTLQYSLSEPQLILGKTYAWRVKAKAIANAEEIGVFKNNGYSEIFSFSYDTYCAPPSGIATSGVSQSQAKISWNGALDNFDYQVNYREKNANSQWYPLVTPREYATISNLKPNTTYEYTVGASCELGKYVASPLQEFTTLAQDEITFTGCGIKPDPNDLTNKTPLPQLLPNDVVTAGDFPIVVLKSSGSNGSFTGEGYVTLPFLEKFKELIDAAAALAGKDDKGNSNANIGKYTRIRITFNNIGVNTDFKLISGEIIASYDSKWGGMVDGDKAVSDIQGLLNDFFTNYKETPEDIEKIKAIENQQNQTYETLIADANISDSDKAELKVLKEKADTCIKNIKDKVPCDTNSGKGEEEIDEFFDKIDCYQKPMEAYADKLKEVQAKVSEACAIPEPIRGCAETGNLENPLNDGDWKIVIKTLKILKSVYNNKKPFIYTKDMTANINAQISIGKVCIEPIMLDYSAMTDKTKTVNEVRFINEITKSVFGGDYWTLNFNELLWIKIPKVIENGKDISKAKIDLLEKWIKCNTVTKEEEEVSTKPATINITAKLLSEVFGDTDKKRLEEVAKAINKYSDTFEINTPLRMTHFLAQIGAETGGLKKLNEEVCYKTKSRIKEVFGKTYYCDLFEGYNSDLGKCSKGHPSPCVPDLDKITSSLEIKGKYVCSSLLMDYVYSCRMGNGNPLSKDGSTFMGKGFIHLTGKSNYEAISNAWNTDKVNKNDKKYFHKQKEDGGHIDELENNIEVAMKASMIFWKINNINKSADEDNVDKVSSIVNGIDPANGIKERKNNLTNFKNILK